MSETADYLKDKYNSAKDIGADKSISTKEAIGQVFGMIKDEYTTAEHYTKSRATRKENVAKRLQEVRKAKHLKQQEVAEKTGINVITLSGYEIGKNEPNLEALVRLADTYEVSLDYLLCRETPDTEQ